MNRILQSVIRRLGYDLVRFKPGQLGKDPMQDMARFLRTDRPLIFDVGANVGQSIQGFRSRFPRSIIHSFEPSPTTFDKLSQQAAQLDDVQLWNCALGSTSGQMTFQENSYSVMSSFLPLSEFGWGEVTKETLVEVTTVDQFCQDHNIEQIDVLKSDTQGFDLEVFKGAERTILANRIKLIYFEIIFSDMYKNLPSVGQTYDFLASRGYLLVSFYRFHYKRQLAGWADALFVHKSCLPANTQAVEPEAALSTHDFEEQ